MKKKFNGDAIYEEGYKTGIRIGYQLGYRTKEDLVIEDLRYQVKKGQIKDNHKKFLQLLFLSSSM